MVLSVGRALREISQFHSFKSSSAPPQPELVVGETGAPSLRLLSYKLIYRRCIVATEGLVV